MSNADKFHIFTFSAWLEIDTSGDVADALQEVPGEVADGKMKIPVSVLSVSAQLNALPMATVTVATGWNISEREVRRSKAHDFLASKTFEAKNFIHAKLMFRNWQTGKSVCIFDGFLSSIRPVYSISGLNLDFKIIHWAEVLAMCPLVCTGLTLEGMSHYTAAFLHKVIPADGGGGGAASRTELASNVSAALRQIKTSFQRTSGDVVKEVFWTILDKLHQFNTEEGIKIPDTDGVFTAHEGSLPQGYGIKEVLGSAQTLGGFAHSPVGAAGGGFEPIVFRPDLPRITNKTILTDIPDRLIDAALDNLPDIKVAQGTAWSFLQTWASIFSLAIVPRVHEIRFIPMCPVFKGDSGSVLELDHVISVSCGDSMQSPAAAVVMLPSSIEATTRNADDFFNLKKANFAARRGVFTHPSKDSGPVHVQPLPPVLSGFIENKEWMDEYAEHEFWRRQFVASEATVLSPIRFDVCPGSTVKFSAGINALTEMENVGFVHGVTWNYCLTQGATCQFHTSFVRSVSSLEDHGTVRHFYYNTKPFLNATWVNDPDFKTF